MSGTLHWSVKPSLISYVATVAEGELQFAGGADGSFEAGITFPVVEREWGGPGSSGEVIAGGSVTVFGHGMRMFEFVEPRITFREEDAVLSVRRWAGRDALLDVAQFELAAGQAVGNDWTWPTVALLPSGRELFDFRYDAGELLSPLTLTAGTVS